MKKLLFILSLFCAFQWVKAAKGDSCTITGTRKTLAGEITVYKQGTLDEKGICVANAETAGHGLG